MPLTLFEDTFVTMADADLLNQADSRWATASTLEKEEALRTATLTLNDTPWLSRSVSPSQTLTWPRETFSFYDPAMSLSVEVVEGTVPQRLKQATANLAKHYLRFPQVIAGQDPTYDRLKIGPLEIEDTNPRSAIPSIPYQAVTLLVQPLVSGSFRPGAIWWRAN
jgi:hypothetical protein